MKAPSTTNRFQRPPEQPAQLSSRSTSAPSCQYNEHLITVHLYPPSSRLIIEFRRLSATVATAQLFPEGLHSASISLSDRTLSATQIHPTKGPKDSKGLVDVSSCDYSLLWRHILRLTEHFRRPLTLPLRTNTNQPLQTK